jgi:hypothetical protein
MGLNHEPWKKSFDSWRCHLLEDAGDEIQRFFRKEPDAPELPAVDALEGDIKIALLRSDRTDDILIRPERVRQGSVWRITQLIQASRKPTVENNSQLSGQILGRFTPERSIQIQNSDFGVALAGRA